jgi:hypothetical protein
MEGMRKKHTSESNALQEQLSKRATESEALQQQLSTHKVCLPTAGQKIL